MDFNVGMKFVIDEVFIIKIYLVFLENFLNYQNLFPCDIIVVINLQKNKHIVVLNRTLSIKFVDLHKA